MSTLNKGTSTVTFDFKNKAKGDDFNKLLRGAIKPGVFSGAAITSAGGNDITIPPYSAFLNVDQDKFVHISTSLSFDETVTPASDQDYLYMTYSWSDVIANYPDYAVRAYTDDPVTNEVILGTVNSSGGSVTTVNTTGQIKSLWNPLYEMQIDTINENSTDNGVDVEGVHFEDNDIKCDEILEKTTDNGVYIEGVHFENNIMESDTINEITPNHGIDIEGVHLENDDIKCDEILEKTIDNGVDIEGVHFENNIMESDTINEKTGAAGVTIDGTTVKDGILTDDGAAGVGIEETSGAIVRTKIISIGGWDMDGTPSLSVAHGVTATNIRRINVTIRDDNQDQLYDWNCYLFGTAEAITQSLRINSTNVVMEHDAEGFFDQTLFNDSGINRGWIVIDYID